MELGLADFFPCPARVCFSAHPSDLVPYSFRLPDGICGGPAAGFLLQLASQRIYLADDTGLMFDMMFIGIGGRDLAVLPIGDIFTLGSDDSLEAIKLLNPARVIPCHYKTWPPIEQDADAWADRVRKHTAAEPVVLLPGETYPL